MLGAEKFQKAFLLLLVLFISILFFEMIRPFIMTILLAAISTGLSYRLYTRLLKLFGQRAPLAAAVTLLTVTLVVFIPLMFFFGIVVNEAISVTTSVGPWMQRQVSQPDKILEALERLPGVENLKPYREQIITKLGQVVGFAGNFLVNGLSATTKGTLSFFFHFFILLYTMFFFLLHGPKVLERIMYYLPLESDEEMRMATKFTSVARATLKGTLVIGMLQGGLAGISFAIAGIPSWIFWATVMTVLSIIPGIGVALVWVPATIYLFAIGHTGMAVFVGIYCALFVGSIDNFLRPRLVGKDTKMPDLMVLLGTLGGVMLFGVIGFIIGPIVAALFVTVWEIYGVVFKDLLPGTRPGD